MRKIQTQQRTMTIQAVPEYSLAYVYDTNLKRYQARHFLRGEIPETINNKPVLANMLPPGQYTIAVGDYIKIDTEYMYITARSTNTITVDRGVWGSTIATHNNDRMGW